jgi:hypothetical protein
MLVNCPRNCLFTQWSAARLHGLLTMVVLPSDSTMLCLRSDLRKSLDMQVVQVKTTFAGVLIRTLCSQWVGPHVPVESRVGQASP